MIITFASGKGGTGKTTMAVNYALTLHGIGHDVAIVDADVEEPNVHLFVSPELDHRVSVTVDVPEVDLAVCNYCGKCAKLCQFGGIVCFSDTVTVFPELCHSCGGCELVCPVKAVAMSRREIGVVEEGEAREVHFAHGRLHVGEPRAVPLIAALKDRVPSRGRVVVDCPPGSSCSAMEAIRGSDFVCLVAEPTPFGLNDLKMIVEAVRLQGIDMGVVINRSDIGDDRLVKYCEEEGLEVLMEMPNDRQIAEAYSRGHIELGELEHAKALLDYLVFRIEKRLSPCAS